MAAVNLPLYFVNDAQTASKVGSSNLRLSGVRVARLLA